MNGTQVYDVQRCRRHGVEFADALAPPIRQAHAKLDLDSMYGALTDALSARYTDFMDQVERVSRPPGVLHDVGCGNGQLLVEARRRGWQVQGNDVVSGVERALSARTIPFHLGFLGDLQLPQASVDVVTSFCVLPHHLTDPLPDLKAAFNVLRPGGWFVLQLPDRGPYRQIAMLLYRLSGPRAGALLGQLYQPGGHQFGFARRSLASLLRRSGFGAIRFDDYNLRPYWSTRRFAGRTLPRRALATAAVYGMYALSRSTGRPNHMFVYAQKPSAPS